MVTVLMMAIVAMGLAVLLVFTLNLPAPLVGSSCSATATTGGGGDCRKKQPPAVSHHDLLGYYEELEKHWSKSASAAQVAILIPTYRAHLSFTKGYCNRPDVYFILHTDQDLKALQTLCVVDLKYVMVHVSAGGNFVTKKKLNGLKAFFAKYSHISYAVVLDDEIRFNDYEKAISRLKLWVKAMYLEKKIYCSVTNEDEKLGHLYVKQIVSKLNNAAYQAVSPNKAQIPSEFAQCYIWYATPCLYQRNLFFKFMNESEDAILGCGSCLDFLVYSYYLVLKQGFNMVFTPLVFATYENLLGEFEKTSSSAMDPLSDIRFISYNINYTDAPAQGHINRIHDKFGRSTFTNRK